MEKDFNSLIENIKKCDICKNKFGFQPHPIILGNIYLTKLFNYLKKVVKPLFLLEN